MSLPQEPSTSQLTAESTSITSISERDSCSEKDKNSAWDKDRSVSRASSSTSAATLTNVGSVHNHCNSINFSYLSSIYKNESQNVMVSA